MAVLFKQSFGLSLLASLFKVTRSAVPTALSITPSLNWYGDDGDWSAITLRIGEPEQWVDIIPSTASSETWVISADGCNGNSLCISNRGGVFNKSTSKTWQELGFYELGTNEELGNTAYAEYGLDTITFGSTGVSIPASTVGTVNATGYTWLGFFGLGTIPGSFSDKTPMSALSTLVEKTGVISSHSYGYTAGAKYRQKGVPNSLTLGGYDTQRFIPHETTFQLNPSQQPYATINSISIVSGAASNNWTTPVQLVTPADRVAAIIDSSTSFLWLPRSVCETFAEVLGLTYNSTLNLYTFDGNTTQNSVLQNSQLTFTMSLGDHAASAQSVNVTLPYDAFDLELTYPAIPNTTYGSDASTKKYFPLRQADSEEQYRIGRVFMQEAYLITDYERNTFSVHQALFPLNPISNTTIVAIGRDATTTFSGPPSDTRKKLSAGAIAGIVIGTALLLIALILGLWWMRRRKQKATTATEQDSRSTETEEIIDLSKNRGFRPPLVHETTGSTSYATEVGADASHERFELAAPLGPVELESPEGTLQGSSTQASENLSSYEHARRKLEEQQAAERYSGLIGSKTENDVSQVAHYRPSDLPHQDSLMISPLASDRGSIVSGQPSPLTPGFMPQDTPAPPSYQRINPDNVVYAGRLPDNVQLPAIIPRMGARNGHTSQIQVSHSEVSDPSTASVLHRSEAHAHRNGSHDPAVSGPSNGHRQSDVSPLSTQTSSGAAELARQAAAHNSVSEDTQMRSLLSQRGDETRIDGDDIVHIPQPAERRFSFEENNTYSGSTQ